MQPAKVSVVIPAYNCERFIAAALDSVLAQTYQPSEIIVVDDGSRDGTAGVLRSYAGRIRCLYQENRGEPAARNLGVRHASGEFIAFLDGDDLWLPQKLQLQMDYFDTHPACALVYTDMKTFDEHGVIEESVRERFNIIFPSGNIFPQLFRETLFGSGSVVCRRACLDRVGLFDEKLLNGSDYEMWLRIARHFEVGYIDQPVMMYRQHANMSTRTQGRLVPDEVPWEAVALTRIVELYPEVVQELGKREVNHRFSKPHATLAHLHLRLGDHATARRQFVRAIAYWPSNWQYWMFYMASFLRPAQMMKVKKFYRKLFVAPVLQDKPGRAQASS